MSTDVATPAEQQLLDRHRARIPFTRLVRVQLRAWRGQRGLVWLTGIAMLLGLSVVLFRVNSMDENPTAALIEQKFRTGSIAFTLLWLAIGAAAGAAPFRSGWAGMILSVAPRRPRWMAASYASIVGWAAGTILLYGALSWTLVTALLARDGDATAGVGVLGAIPNIAVIVLVSVTVGFGLGTAARGVAIPLMIGYVGVTLIPALDGPSRGISRLIELDSAIVVAAGMAKAPHGVGPVIAALVVWTVVPAAIAVWQLQKSDVR